MFDKIRLWALALAFAVSACVSTGLPDGATYEHRYFAAVADYNQAKTVALAYVSLEETPFKHVKAVVDVVERVDARLREFERRRRLGGTLEPDFVHITTVLKVAVGKLKDPGKE